MDETMTQKQRVAVEAMEAAQRAGVPLSDYAKAKGLELRPVYDAIAALRRRGALPRPHPPAQAQEPFCRRAGGELAVTGNRDYSSDAQRHGVPPGVRARVGHRVHRVAAGGLVGRASGAARGCCGLTGASSASTCTVRRWT